MIIQIFESKTDRNISFVCKVSKNTIRYFEFLKMNLQKEITLEEVTKNYTGEACLNHVKHEFFNIAEKQIADLK